MLQRSIPETHRPSHRSSSRLAPSIALLCLAIACVSSTWAVEEEVRAIRYPKILLESEPRPAEDLDLPPSSYPLTPLNRAVIHGSRHGFLSTSSGTLSFKAFEIRLPGRMPIEFAPVYSSGISESLPPALPGQGGLEPRRVRDLGLNWILDYASYLTTTPTGVSMWTPEGDTIVWVDQGNNTFRRSPDVASHHLKLQRITSPPPTKYVETRSDGTKWTYKLFTGGFFLTEIKDRSGNTITLTYTNNLLSRVENSDGAWINILRPLYDPQYPPVVFPQERVVQITDSTGRVMHFDYNSAGLLTSVTDVLGEEWTFTYGADSKLATALDPLGNEYLNVTYDTAHRVASYEAGDGPWTLNYATPHVTKATDALGNQWQYDYDSNSGVTTRVVEPTTGDYQVVLDVNKNPVAYEGPEGGDAVWTYDSEHRPLSYRPPESTVSVQYSYNTTEGWLNSLTRLDGTTTTFVRDTAGRVTEERETFEYGTYPTYPERAWTASYAANGDRLSLRMPNGNIGGVGQGWLWTFTYDAFGNIDTATDPTGRVFEFDFTPQGDLWKFRRPDHEDPPGTIVKAQWIHTRDLLGRVTAETDPLGNVWTWTYDEAGRLERKDGPAGTAIRYGYDDRFRVTEIIQEQPGAEPDFTSAIGYDAAGRLTSKTTPGGSTWTYGYDASSRLTSITDPLERETSYTRDLAGKIVTITHPGGRQVTMMRDAAGRLTQRAYPGGRTENFEYDVAGRLSLAEYQPNAGVEWTYDELGQPATVHSYLDWNSRELTYSYDPNGNRWRRAGGTTELYEYDELDRLISSDSYFPWLATYDEVSGRRTSVTLDHEPNQNNYPGINADEETWEYDLAGRVINHSWQMVSTDDGDVTYAYDAEGRTTLAQTTDDRTLETVFNPLGLPERREYTEDDVLTATDLEYDDDGRLLQSLEQEGTDEPIATTFEWDEAGRLSAATRDLTRRTYTWEDAPQDVDSASMRVWRAPDDTTEDTIEAQYDYEGRLLSTTAHSAENPPTSLNTQAWLPFESPTMFYRTLRHHDGTDEVMWSVIDAGGSTWMEVDQGTGSWTRLLSEITAIDRWAESRRFLAASPAVQLDNPFRLGQWEPSAFRAIDERLEPPGLVTGLSATRSLIDEILSFEKGGDVTIDDAPSPGFSDVVDNWLGDLLAPKGLSGQSQRKDRDVGRVNRQATLATDGWRHVDIRDFLRSMTVMWTYNNFTLGDMNLNSGYVCFGGRTGGHPRLAPTPGGEDCAWWGDVPRTGGGSCVVSWRYNRPVGSNDSFNYPDHSPWGVSLMNGEYTTSSTDLTVFDASGDLSFSRTYKSGVRYDGDLGWRWFHNWEESLDFGTATPTQQGTSCSDEIRWISPDGSYMTFGVGWNPPGSLYQLSVDGDTYQLRHPSGTVKHFDSAGRLTQIVRGRHATILNYDESVPFNQHRPLLSISTQNLGTSEDPIVRIEFQYDAQGRLWKVHPYDDPSREVTYSYTSCNELETVTWPAPNLGFDANGQTIGAPYAPQTRYTYRATACQEGLARNHKLEKIEVRQYNPLTGGDPTWETVVKNEYHDNTSVGSADFQFMRVTGQCIGQPSCSPSDIAYAYASGYTAITDNRVSEDPTEERHFYNSDHELSQITDDYGGDRVRHTYFDIEDGLLRKVTNPDGTCVVKTYESVAGVDRVVEERFRAKQNCQGGTSTTPDRVTRYTYEPAIGKVRTVTGPDAFPNGTVDNPFIWDAVGVKDHTTVFDYDVHQTASTEDYPEGLQELIDRWQFEPPPKLGNLNGSPTDDDEFQGTLVRTKKYIPTATPGTYDEFVTLQRNQSSGRLLEVDHPDGTKTRYNYYTSAAQSDGWDWRGTTGDPITALGGQGPLASIDTVASDGATLTKRYAYDPEGRLIAEQSPGGVRREFDRPLGSERIAERVVCDPGVQSCAVVNPELVETQYTYDLRGRQIRAAVYDGAGGPPEAVTWTTYDVFGRPVTVTVDPDPTVMPGSTSTNPNYLHLMSRNYYDRRGRVTKATTPEGRVTCFAYDSLDRTISATRHERMQPDGAGGAVCPAVHADDATVQTRYDVMDRVFEVKDPKGFPTYSFYDALGRLEFTSNGKPSGAQNPTLAPGETLPSFPTVSWYRDNLYDVAGRVKRSRLHGRDGMGHSGFLQASWTEYDSLGRVEAAHVAIANPTGGAHAGFVGATAANSPTPPTGVTLATARRTYDADGRLESEIDPGGHATTYSYDEFGRQEVITLPPPAASEPSDTVTNHYDTAGRLFKVVRTIHDPNDVTHDETTESKHDAWGRVVETVGDPASARMVTTVKYDALGRVKTTAKRWSPTGPYTGYDPLDRVEEREYDGAGRLEFTRRREDTSTWVQTTYEYDRDGLQTAMIDPNLNQTDWVYEDETSALGGIGRMRRVLYPQTPGTFERQTVDYAYDRNGNVLTTEMRAKELLQSPRVVLTQQYDDYNRMTSRSAAAYNVPAGTEFYGTTEQSFAYDDLGRMVEAVDRTPSHPDGEYIRVALKYDTAGRKREENQRLPLNGGLADHVVSSTYGIDGLRTTLSYPETYNASGQALNLYTLTFDHDDRHRLTGITGPNGPQEPAFGATRGSRALLTYDYVGGRPWSRWQGNFTETRFHSGAESLYDGLGRPTRMWMVDEGNANTILPDFSYGYDRVGNRLFEMRRHERMSTGPNTYRTRGFSTDLMDRMVSWREGPVDPEDNPIVPHADPASLVPSPSGGERWGIDLVGNWDQKWTGMPGSETLNDFEINHLNQYASVTPQGGTVKAFTYDWLGQLRLNQSRSQTYAWDLFGRLTKVYEVGVTDPVAVYRYDALNRRVEKTDGRDLPVDQTTRFIYDDWRAIEERTIEDGTPDREVVRARYGFGRGLDEVVWMDRDIDRDGSIESRLFTHQDGQGSTVLITSDRSSSASALQRIEWFEYTAYGQVTSWNLPWSETEDRYTGTSQGDSRFRLPYVFTGQRLDSESGLMYFKNRYYDPATGRFLQRDPLGYADGPSLYQYARSNPAMYVDRLGLKSWLMSQMEGLVASANIAGRFAQNPELSAMMDSTDERKSDSREEKAEGEASGQGGADAAQEKAETAATEKGTPIVAVKIEPSDEPKKGTYKATYLRADGQLQTAYLNDKFEVNRATFDEDAGKLDDASGEGKMISDFYGGLEQGDVLFRMDEGGRKDVAFVRGTVDKNGNLPIISYGPEPGAKAKKGTLNGADDGYAGYAVVGVWKPPDRASAREYDRRWDAWQRKDKDGYKAGSGFFQCYNLVNALSGKGQTYVKTFFPPTLDDRNLKYWEWLMGLAELDGFPMP